MNTPDYKKKLELSYLKCMEELSNPSENWEEILDDAKFTMDQYTGRPMTNYTFVLDGPDDIIIPQCVHNYVFKRSHFYSTFLKQSSRLKRDLIKCWYDRGYFVDLYFDCNIWKMKLSWKKG